MTLARRNLLQFGLASGAAAVGAGSLAPGVLPRLAERSTELAALRFPALPTRRPSVAAAPAPRRAFVHNLHTGETLDAVYFENGAYVPDALAAAMRVLRDWRNGDEHMMDPRLFDLMHALRARVETTAPFQIISGYRSPATNAMLHARSGEVAAKSQHTLGKASDIRVQGVELVHLRQAAMSLRGGGVGFYPVSDFVHVDVGPVRHWSGT